MFMVDAGLRTCSGELGRCFKTCYWVGGFTRPLVLQLSPILERIIVDFPGKITSDLGGNWCANGLLNRRVSASLASWDVWFSDVFSSVVYY